MKCSQIEFELPHYADGMTSEAMAGAIRAHLDVCPLCRQKNSDYISVKNDLRHLRRHEISQGLAYELKQNLRVEAISMQSSVSGSNFTEWLQMRVMPYAVGVVASVVIGFSLLIVMLSGMLRPDSPQIARDGRTEPVLLAGNLSREDRNLIVPPMDFVNSRMAYSNESPSINPEGALMAFTKSMVRGRMKDEEVVVVADVFSNGLARITEVVESPDDRQTVEDLERAFRSDPGASPFVPAVMENRPENMRIVLKLFQSVNVDTRPRPSRRRS